MRHSCFMLLVGFTLMLSGRNVLAEQAGSTVTNRPSDDAVLSARSVVHAGDTTRLQCALAKAQRGVPVTVAVIGGSITEGASASGSKQCYGNLVAAWWEQQFPQSRIKFINAGIGATGSDYGALRAQRDLLAHKPDFVVVEFAVNDPNTRECAESLEGLVRQILRDPAQPALLLLFTMRQDGSNAQEWHGRVGRHYGLPMISFRDGLWPEIQSGRLKWEEVEADVVHPNDRGHAYAARFVTDFLASVLRSLPTETRPAPTGADLPAPLISDLFQHVSLREADALKPVSNRGWAHSPQDRCWKSDKPGSVIEFEIEGQAILMAHYVVRGPMGRASVSVDGGAPKQLEAWFDATWGGYRQTNQLARGLPAGKHRVRIELLADKNPQSTGYEFRIMNLGSAG